MTPFYRAPRRRTRHASGDPVGAAAEVWSRGGVAFV